MEVDVVRLVRHCETSWTATGRYCGQVDVGLTERGRADAVLLGESLQKDGPWDGTWASDLVRTLDTARLAGFDPTKSRDIREFDFGAIEGRTWDELPESIQTGLLAFDGFVAPGGESVAEFRRRVVRFVTSLGEGRQLVFTHGGVIRLLLREVSQQDLAVPPGGWVDLDHRALRALRAANL